MLVVGAPAGREPEREYAVSSVLGGILGLEFRVVTHARPVWTIRVADDTSGEIVLPDALLGVDEQDWLTARSLPVTPLPRWHANGSAAEPLPVLYGASNADRSIGEAYSLPVDVFGSAFFMLTRYEERVSGAVDAHGRFPASDAVAVREGFVRRAIVNEYAEQLWAAVERLCPGAERPARSFRVYVTHDVDWALSVGQSAARVSRLVAGDLLRRHDIDLFARRLAATVRYRARRTDVHDPVDTFDFIMDVSEDRGFRSAFYFLSDAARLPRVHNDAYSIDSEPVRSLLRTINVRGHEIGLHGSYESHGAPRQLAAEADRLRGVAAAIGIEQDRWGGRQHFLRFASPGTWAAWAAAGLAYDSSVGYAEAPGFRCGVADEFRVFDLDSRRALDLIERPLIAMEGSFLDPQYGGQTPAAAVPNILALADTCRRHRGAFTLLWHNSSLVRRVERDAYRTVLEALSGGG
jgi:hypothetical protein